MEPYLKTLLETDYPEAVRKLSTDYQFYAKNLYQIRDKNSRRQVYFLFNTAQKMVWRTIKHLRETQERWFLEILKSRQQGISTECLGYDFWLAANEINFNSLMLTDRGPLTDKMFLQLKKFYYGLPEKHDLKPAHRLDNRGVLYLDAKDGKSGLNSQIVVGTAGSTSVGVGFTIDHFHLAEFALYFKECNVELMMTDIFNAMPKTGRCSGIIETTARPGEYEAHWFKNKSYHKLFIPYIADDSYRIKNPKHFELQNDESMHYGNELDEAELTMKTLTEVYPEKYDGASVDPELKMALEEEMWECLAFRRQTIDIDCQGKKDLFRRDFPLTAKQAFHYAGNYAFPQEVLRAQREQVAANPPSPVVSVENPLRLNFTKPVDYDLGWHQAALQPHPNGKVVIYVKPDPEKRFCLGADVSEGNLNSDDCSIRGLMCGDPHVEAFAFDGQIEMYAFADLIFALSLMFGEALIGVERNAVGVGIIKRLQDLKVYYPVPNQYQKKVQDRITNQFEMRYGWHTNQNTKPFMVADLNEAITYSQLAIVHPVTFDQCLAYQELTEGGWGGVGEKDDAVASLMIALQMAKEVPKFIPRSNERREMTLKDIINLHRYSQLGSWRRQ